MNNILILVIIPHFPEKIKGIFNKPAQIILCKYTILPLFAENLSSYGGVISFLSNKEDIFFCSTFFWIFGVIK